MYVAVGRDLGDNEVMGSTARSEWDEDAEVEVWSDKEGYDPKLTFKINKKSNASMEQNNRGTAQMVRPCYEEWRGEHSKKSAICGNTREKNKRMVGKL